MGKRKLMGQIIFNKYLESNKKNMFSDKDNNFKIFLKTLPYINDSIIDDELSRYKNNFRQYNPLDNNASRILLFGEVQSGKTNNIIYCLNELMDIDFQLCIYLTGTKNNLLNQTYDRISNAFRIISRRDISVTKAGTKIKESQVKSVLKNNKKLILMTLKATDSLKNILNVLKGLNNHYRTVIINDEGDEASVSVKNKILTTEETINKIIDYNDVEKNLYIALTASPFKNILNENIKITNSFILESNKKYTGLNYFLNANENFFKIINNNDWKECVFNSLIYWINKILKNKCKSQKYQLLLNIFIKKTEHKEIQNFIKDIASSFKHTEKCLIWEENILKVENNLKLSNFNYEEYREIFKSNKFEEIVYNSESKKEPSRITNQIIIGSLKLSRGITFNNLISEVLLVGPKNYENASTLLQRARWLGYREGKPIKIFTSQKIFNALNEVQNLIELTKKAINENMNITTYQNKFDKYKILKEEYDRKKY